LPVWRNGDCRKTNFVILPLHRPRPESEDARARLPPPNRHQIAVNIMSSSNLDNTGPRRQTLLHDPKLLGSAPPPSPLWTGQNRNRRHVCSFACKLMSKSSHARARCHRSRPVKRWQLEQTIEARAVINAVDDKKADVGKEGEGDAHPIEMSA
jgi:hypothetical protein